jgi:hypothetical protein
MPEFNHFSAENFGLSVVGHLAVAAVALFLTTVVFFDAPERFIAPDRIQITEIDLSQVRVSGDESILYNTNTAESAEVPEKPAETPPARAPESDPVPNKDIDAPSMLDDAKSKEVKKEEPKPEPKPDDTPAPKKKTVVRVNRDVVSLDRTLTVSVVDALRVAMTRCWVIDTKRPDIADIRVVAHLKMRQNGTVADVWFESAARAETDAAFAYVLGTIRNAINVCQPLKMLPPNEYTKWRDIQLTFYPTQGKVM